MSEFKRLSLINLGLSAGDRTVVEDLFGAGAIQVIVVSRTLCWALSKHAHLVVIMDTQSYNGQQHMYDDYALTDLIQMAGRANRPREDGIFFQIIFPHFFSFDFLLINLSYILYSIVQFDTIQSQ